MLPAKARTMARQELLARVLSAQEGTSYGYATALREMRAGHKQTCWMWWIWPTLAGVRETRQPEFYVPDAEAVLEWLRHPKLGPRFVEITHEAVSHLNAGVSPLVLFGWQQVDVDKFHECVTLFGEVTRSFTRGSDPDPMRDKVRSLCHDALNALQRPPHQKTLEVLHRTGAVTGLSFRPHPPLDPHSFNRTESNPQDASTPPRTEVADFLAELGLAAYTAVMRADGFDSIAALGTMDSDDATEMRTALAARGVPRGDVDRILGAAAARVRDSTLQAENALRMRQASGSGAAAGTPVQPQPPPVSHAASVADAARPASVSRLLSQQPHPPRGAGGAPQAFEAVAAAGAKAAAAARTQSPVGDLTVPQGGGCGGWNACAGAPVGNLTDPPPPLASLTNSRRSVGNLTDPPPPLASTAVARFAPITVRKGDNDAEVAQQAHVCLRRMNEATLADPKTAEQLRPLCTADAPVRDGGWSCMRMASVAPPNTAPLVPNTAPRLLALDVEMIERRADGVRLPVSAALICYDLSPRQPKRVVLFSGLVDPTDFDREWRSGPAAYDYKVRAGQIRHRAAL